MRAFSLVEISIVLVILGLLTGGILAGQSLIRAAEVRSIAEEFGNYVTAVHTFQDKYIALPGDMSMATQIWGARDGNDGIGPDCRDVPSTDKLTCNGNGDGAVRDWGTTTSPNEAMRFWQHLSNAGMISGQYSGENKNLSPDISAEIGYNVPISKISNASFVCCRGKQGQISATAYSFRGNYGIFSLVYASISSSGSYRDPVLSPSEAWSVDTKLDDGRAATGHIISGWADSCTTALDGDDTAADYNLTNSTKKCFLYMIY